MLNLIDTCESEYHNSATKKQNLIGDRIPHPVVAIDKS